MRTIVGLGVIAALFVSILSGCAAQNGGIREHQGAAVGAGAGAVGGAVVGGLIGGKRGAVAGGLLGALAGGLLGNYHDEREKNLAETRRAHTEYDAAKGTRLKIEQVRAIPPTAAPGDTVEIQLTYAVLTPREDVMVPVRENREILFGGSKVGRPRSTSSARVAPGAQPSPSRSPGTPVRGSTASSPRWSRAA